MNELSAHQPSARATQLIADRPGWRRVRFGDVVDCVNDTVADPREAGFERVVGLEHLDPGSLHIRRWASIEDGTTFTRRFRPGQVLFGKRRVYQRKLALAEFDGICSGDILVFEPKNDDLVPELLPFMMQAEGFWQHALNTSAGSLSPRTKWQDLASYEFALPPKEEQRRIAEILWSADLAKERWSEAVTSMTATRATIVNGVFDEKRSPGWNNGRLEQFATFQTGLAKGKRYERGLETEELPYLRVANVQDGYLDLSEMKTITVASDEVSRYSLRDGDVLLNEGGDFDKVGRGAVWRSQVLNCLHQNHVFCVRPDPTKLLSDFLSIQTGSAYGKRYWLNCSKQTTNLASINLGQVRAFPVLVPSLQVQKRIIEDVERCDAAIQAIKHHLELTRLLLLSLMPALLNHSQ